MLKNHYTPPAKSVVAVLFLIVTAQAGAADYCWQEAASEYRIAPELLKAISRVESDSNPYAINVNRTTVDHGHMQINSGWLKDLERYGVSRQHLFEPCTSTKVGAWILAKAIEKYGYSWEAIGAYHASEKMPGARRAYAWKVFRAMEEIMSNPNTRVAQ